MHYQINDKKSSIHINQFPGVPEIWNNQAVAKKWEFIQDVRKAITEALEIERSSKAIGSSLEAEICIYCKNPENFKIISEVDFAEIAIVSKATIVNAQNPSNGTIDEDIDIGVVVKRIEGTKCDRCWKISEGVKITQTEYGDVNLCSRCKSAL
jgi:isoleucyl-tRNA synthetase